MPLKDLTGFVEKIGSSYFASTELTEIWKGTLSGERSTTIVAVKMIRGGAASTAANFQPLDEELLQEARILSLLDHPNIISIRGVCRNLGRGTAPCLVFPYFQNGDVGQYLSANADADRMELVSQIACGLAYMHERGIIHRDIKPRNILVNDKGEACIADFGLSRRQGVIDEVKGTPYYMARELLSYEYCGGSVPPITAASDVWAFGMTCLEILTGRWPFYWERHVGAIINSVINGRRPSHQYYPEISHDVWQVLEGCWHKHPAQRPSMNYICANFKHE